MRLPGPPLADADSATDWIVFPPELADWPPLRTWLHVEMALSQSALMRLARASGNRATIHALSRPIRMNAVRGRNRSNSASGAIAGDQVWTPTHSTSNSKPKATTRC